MYEVPTLEQLESQEKSVLDQVEFGKSIDALMKNKDFIRVFSKGFLEKDCARYVKESIDTNLEDANRADALAMAQAAGYVAKYLNINLRLAAMCAADLVSLREAIQDQRNAPQTYEG